MNDNLIVLGAANGKAFIGNPKYLYYYLKNNTNYKLIWLAKSKELRTELKAKGIYSIPNFSIDAIRYLRKARAVFVSHGYGDVLPIKFPPRTVVVQTWHGGFIKIKGKHPYFTKYINSKWTTITRVKIRHSQFFDYCISASSEKKQLEFASNVFKFPIKRIIVTGYPRNDILFTYDSDLIKMIRNNYNIPEHIKRIILYAPTYRELKNSRNPFEIEDFLKINDICKKKKTLFLIKAHINEKIINFKDLENIKLINKDVDIQELLIISNILITDYSSVMCDYILLDRPILLYPYDYDDYITHRGIYYDSLEDIAPGPIFSSAEDLINAIENIEEIYQKYESNNEKIKNLFNKYKDGNSSERLLRFLKLI